MGVTGHGGGLEGHAFQLELAGLDLRQVEHVVEDGQQHVARLPDDVEPVLLGSRQPASGHGLGHAEDAVQGRADLVAHIGQELGLGPVGGLGRGPRGPRRGVGPLERLRRPVALAEDVGGRQGADEDRQHEQLGHELAVQAVAAGHVGDGAEAVGGQGHREEGHAQHRDRRPGHAGAEGGEDQQRIDQQEGHRAGLGKGDDADGDRRGQQAPPLEPVGVGRVGGARAVQGEQDRRRGKHQAQPVLAGPLGPAPDVVVRTALDKDLEGLAHQGLGHRGGQGDADEGGQPAEARQVGRRAAEGAGHEGGQEAERLVEARVEQVMRQALVDHGVVHEVDGEAGGGEQQPRTARHHQQPRHDHAVGQVEGRGAHRVLAQHVQAESGNGVDGQQGGDGRGPPRTFGRPVQAPAVVHGWCCPVAARRTDPRSKNKLCLKFLILI